MSERRDDDNVRYIMMIIISFGVGEKEESREDTGHGE